MPQKLRPRKAIGKALQFILMAKNKLIHDKDRHGLKATDSLMANRCHKKLRPRKSKGKALPFILMAKNKTYTRHIL